MTKLLDSFKNLDRKYLYAVIAILIFLILSVCTVVGVYFALLPHIEPSPTYGYKCEESRCLKYELTPENIQKAISLPVCRLFCNEEIGTLWPKPSGSVKIGQYMVRLSIDHIEIHLPPYKEQNDLWKENEERLKSQINSKVLDENKLKKNGKGLIVKIHLDEPDLDLDYSTDEGYKLLLSQGDGDVFADVHAKNFFGARHGLETLSQLIVYDDIRNELQILAEGEINDAPAYKHRGLLLDTSRNYFSVQSIKKTIDAMAMVKLNAFHWHVTDSHSFPLVLKSQPSFVKYGAYSVKKIYTAEDIDDITKYALARGVRIIPEFDAPAHVGEGWQKKNMTVCFNAQPWQSFCVEPPCGQLDPTNNDLYNVLEDIYREMIILFKKPNIFHMGGDEVSVSCWNSSATIRNWMSAKGWNLEEEDFLKLWGHFQENALKRIDRINVDMASSTGSTSTGKLLPIIMWTSRLTEVPYLEEYLDKNRYIIQIWTTGQDSKLQDILKRGYQVILSNYDALYFDCGFGGWVNDGNNWCSPYIGWQKVYMNAPEKIAGQYHSQVLGGEAAIWSEQIDEFTLDSRLWPRASALAERLWSNPSGHWRNAESRILVHRERLVENGIQSEALQPEWCLQNEGECPIN